MTVPEAALSKRKPWLAVVSPCGRAGKGQSEGGERGRGRPVRDLPGQAGGPSGGERAVFVIGGVERDVCMYREKICFDQALLKECVVPRAA